MESLCCKSRPSNKAMSTKTGHLPRIGIKSLADVRRTRPTPPSTTFVIGRVEQLHDDDRQRINL